MPKRILSLIAVLSLVWILFTANVYADFTLPMQVVTILRFGYVGLWFSILSVALVITVEAYCIKKLLSTTFRAACGWSFIINAITSCMGFFLLFFPLPFLDYAAKILGEWFAGVFFGLLPGYILTVAVEGLLLIGCSAILKRGRKAFDCYKTSVVMNFYSYLFLASSLIIAEFIKWGNLHGS